MSTRELRLKYLINLVSDVAARTKQDEKALTEAQGRVRDSLGRTTTEATKTERAIVRAMTLGARGAKDHADRLAYLALKYQDVRKAAEGASAAMGKVQGLAAGTAAGAYTLDRFARAPMEYSLRLAHMANTAYADRDIAGRQAGKRELNAAITAAIRAGGGSRDDAAGALDAMIASGAVPIGQAIRMLPALMRGSTASGASAEQLAQIGLRGMQTFDIRPEQVPELLNMAMVAGQQGGFELRDMAKWLPQAMASGRLSGLNGMEGMRRILASMQAGVIVAGSKDEAGNNLINLLGKINSRDTATDMKKAGIDLSGYLAEQRSKGVNSLDAFVSMVDGIAAKDPEYVKLQKQLANAQTRGQKTETLQAMTDILQGKAIGQVIQDRQAMMALVAEMNNRDYVQRVMGATKSNSGAMDTSFGLVAGELAFSRQQFINEGQIATSDALEKVAPALGATAETAARLAQEFPGLASNSVLAAGALGVLAAAASASGLLTLLRGPAGSVVAGAVGGGMLARTAMTGAAGAASAVGAAKGLLGGAGAASAYVRAAGSVAAPLIIGAMEAYSALTDPSLDAEGRNRGLAGAAAGAGGGLAGALAGAKLGALAGPWGILAGGILGGIGGSAVGKGALNWLWSQDPARGVTGPDGKPVMPGAGGKIELGQGQLDVRVSVTDDRVTAVPTVVRQPSIVRIDAGNTNPAGYGGTR